MHWHRALVHSLANSPIDQLSSAVFRCCPSSILYRPIVRSFHSRSRKWIRYYAACAMSLCLLIVSMCHIKWHNCVAGRIMGQQHCQQCASSGHVMTSQMDWARHTAQCNAVQCAVQSIAANGEMALWLSLNYAGHCLIDTHCAHLATAAAVTVDALR